MPSGSHNVIIPVGLPVSTEIVVGDTRPMFDWLASPGLRLREDDIKLLTDFELDKHRLAIPCFSLEFTLCPTGLIESDWNSILTSDVVTVSSVGRLRLNSQPPQHWSYFDIVKKWLATNDGSKEILCQTVVYIVERDKLVFVCVLNGHFGIRFFFFFGQQLIVKKEGRHKKKITTENKTSKYSHTT